MEAYIIDQLKKEKFSEERQFLYLYDLVYIEQEEIDQNIGIIYIPLHEDNF